MIVKIEIACDFAMCVEVCIQMIMMAGDVGMVYDTRFRHGLTAFDRRACMMRSAAGSDCGEIQPHRPSSSCRYFNVDDTRGFAMSMLELLFC
jgi:hypothetical protein